jgi:hypothetical protein
MRFRPMLPLALAAALAAAATLAADRSSDTAKKKVTPQANAPAAANSCKTCVERRPILDGSLFADTRIYDKEAKAAYGVAARIPATIDRLQCFCECAESPQFHHKTLLTCFTDSHAAGCGICVKEALVAEELKKKGASDDEIASLVESMFRTEGHPPLHAR